MTEGVAVFKPVFGAGGAPLGGTNTWTGVNTFDAQVQWSKGADVASATALPILTDGNYYDVTGTTTITSIATTGHVGTVVRLHFDGILTLTHNATDLVLPGAANIVTAAGDEFTFVEFAAGDFRCVAYALASGQAVISGGGSGDLLADGTIPMTADWAFGGFALTGVDQLTVTGDQTTTDTVVLTSTTHTTGELFKVTGNSADTGIRNVAEIIQENASATGATALKVRQDSNQTTLNLVVGATTANGLLTDSASTTTGDVWRLVQADSLTTGRGLVVQSGSSSASTRDLVLFQNSSASATGTTVLKLTQDAANEVMVLDQDATAAGSSFIDYQGTAAANATGPISTFTTSGATTDHIQIELNGAKAWIAVSTNDPS